MNRGTKSFPSLYCGKGLRESNEGSSKSYVRFVRSLFSYLLQQPMPCRIATDCQVLNPPQKHILLSGQEFLLLLAGLRTRQAAVIATRHRILWKPKVFSVSYGDLYFTSRIEYLIELYLLEYHVEQLEGFWDEPLLFHSGIELVVSKNPPG
jgi:hypothetical protein